MKSESRTKMKKTTLVLLLSLTLLMGGNLQPASAQNLDRVNFTLHLSLTPSQVLDDSQSHSIGYIYILNKNGVSVSSNSDVDIMLTSDDPTVASVPEKITFPADAYYAKFDVTTGEIGQTTITALLNDQLGFADIRVGADKSTLPDNLSLELNLPTDKMHVNSEMPFSVFLKTPDELDERDRVVTEGTVIRAPYDIEIILDYEKSLAIPNDDRLTIKAGDYYAWGTITTQDKVGNTFLRAIQADTQLDTAKSIEISSTLPAALSMNIYPYLVPAEIRRTIDIFVTVVDSEGEPTVASEDIPLKFFSNNQDYVGEDLDDTMEELNMYIEAGEFGYHFRQTLDLIGLVSNDLMIGVSSSGLGTAIDRFQTVGESISVEDKRVSDISILSGDKTIKATDRKAVQLFGPLKIPSNSTALFAYQISIEENDDDDTDTEEEDEDFEQVNIDDLIEQQLEEEETRREGVNPQDIAGVGDIDEDVGTDTGTGSGEDDVNDDVIIYNIDYIEEGNLYPIQANEDMRGTGYIQLLDVISEDNSRATVIDPGNIGPSYSYGVAVIESTQKSGEFLISANIKGIGSGSYRTEVVNSLEQKQIMAFSPTGEDSILINRDGSFDLFLVALDGSDRPKVLDSDKKYLVTPTNGIVDIEKNSTFGTTRLQSESFSLEDGGSVVLRVAPIGEDADLELDSTTIFMTQLSAKINVLFPLENLDITKDEHVGVIQMVDLQGNPIESFRDIKTKISSSDEDIFKSIADATIKKGESYAEFPIKTKDLLGSSMISTSARGVVGTETEITTSTSSSSLYIFTSGLVEPMPRGQEIQVKIFVDDALADSVAGATVRITPDENATTTVDVVRTAADGSATFGLVALNGPQISLDFDASAPGYKDGSKTLAILVDVPEGSLAEINAEWIVYLIIGGIAVVAVVIGLFLKKSKEVIDEEEEPWEDVDDI